MKRALLLVLTGIAALATPSFGSSLDPLPAIAAATNAAPPVASIAFTNNGRRQTLSADPQSGSYVATGNAELLPKPVRAGRSETIALLCLGGGLILLGRQRLIYPLW
jgi:hypothetical protein